MGFGVGERLPLDDTQKWLKKIERYNIHADKPYNPKIDPSPSSNTYELCMEWKGKVSKKNRNKLQKNHILDTISKGPVINDFYKRV